MGEKFKAIYLIGCKYPTSNMPMDFSIDSSAIEDDMDDADLRDLYGELCEEHFELNVTADYRREDEFIEWAKQQIAKRK
jgi:hypothetical protein